MAVQWTTCFLWPFCSQQAMAIENTKTAINQLLDYIMNYPSDGLSYYASHMILATHFRCKFPQQIKVQKPGQGPYFPHGRQTHTQAQWSNPRIIKFVMASAAEAELTALFITAQEMVPLQQTLIEMHWPNHNSPIQSYSTVVGFTNDTIVGQQVKMMDMMHIN